VLHRFARIDDQVEHHLQELDGIATHARQTRRDLRNHFHARIRRRQTAEGEGVAHNRLDREGLKLRLALLDEGTHPRDHVGRLLVLAGDLVEKLAYSLEIHVRGGKQVSAGLCIYQNRRQRLPKLVRDSARELAHGGHARDVRELIALLL